MAHHGARQPVNPHKMAAAYKALEFAFNTRIASNFDLMNRQMSAPDYAAARFVEKFVTATDAWNVAKDALEAEYGVGI
jgi:hypothetical protein